MTDTLQRLAALLQDHYALERELGAGGMAAVYLAEDLKHHRHVAVKVLRPELAATMGPERFVREVTIAANLQHPHILPLYDSGEIGGFLYYVMPYVEGPTLRDRLLKERELPVPEAARILRDVADAMAAAHAQGVVHRDLKPENIMLSGRHAMVADFGVAKAVSDATGRHMLTTEGVALGTPTYMAPEQAAADPLTDHRADLYALGVVAYEMLTGQPPFVRSTPQALLAAHVTEAPPDVTEGRSSIPPALAALIMRCLEKKPADRPQSAEEVLGVLESLTTSSGGITPTHLHPVPGSTVPSTASARGGRRKTLLSATALVVVAGAVGTWALLGRGGTPADPHAREPVVVLPFEVQGGDASLASLGVQASEQIASAIEQAGLGRVVPYRTGNGGEAFTPEVARRAIRETGAATLVAGVIAQRADIVEIQARVVRGQDLETLWSLGPDEADATDATPALNAIRERVVGAVGWYLAPVTEGRGNPGLYQPPPSLEILRLASKAGELFRTGHERQAASLVVEAFSRDTTWLPGPMSLGMIYYNLGWASQRDSVLKYVSERRERLAPGDAQSHDWHLAFLGSPEEEHRAAVADFSADSSNAYDALWSSVRARRPDEALGYYALRDTTAAWGRDWQAWDTWAARAYHMLGRYEEELSLARAAKSREPRAYEHWEREVRALACLGRFDEVEQVVTESYGLEYSGAPVQLLYAAALELEAHGPVGRATEFAERALAGVVQWSDSLQWTANGRNVRRHMLRVLGRYEEVLALYQEEEAHSFGEASAGEGSGLWSRILAMRYRVLMGDTVGALALADSARTEPLEGFAGSGWSVLGSPRYYGAALLALLGRKDEAVALLRDALNSGWRLSFDDPYQFYWAPLRDYPPFQEVMKLKDQS